MLTPAIRNLIRDGKTPQMQSYLLSSAKEGSITMDNFLIRMAKEGVITPQTAVDACPGPAGAERETGGGAVLIIW